MAEKSRIPKFKNEDEERNFWATHDSAEFFDELEEVEPIKPARPRTKDKTITFRADDELIERIKKIAGAKGMGYQTLMRAWLYERLEEEEKRVS